MNVFSPWERRAVEKTSVALVRTIRAAILDGRLSPNQPLREVELAKQLGTSRTPIRQALLLLEREGLVEAPPNRAATVRSYDRDELQELYDLRAELEGYATRLAVPRLADEEIEEIEDSCERFAELASGEDVLALADEDFTFHRTLREAAGSPRLARMIRELSALPLLYTSYLAYSPEHRGTVERDHRVIAAALRDRDADRACALMEEHVGHARDIALAHFPQVL